jgi:hypothetical protein
VLGCMLFLLLPGTRMRRVWLYWTFGLDGILDRISLKDLGVEI